ncbi:transglutaminase family protein [Kineococcus gynurae]|uniref:Transglutaminase family protein n=1 Tax=Kineococcus gynurae TaxID=452979 RepID=A0ABV5LVA1_9ACTN
MPSTPAPALTARVSARLDLSSDRRSPASLLLSVAGRPGVAVLEERLEVVGPDGPLTVTAVAVEEGGRMHTLDVPAGDTRVEYEARVALQDSDPVACSELDRWALTRPSRYSPSDALASFAARELNGVSRADLPRAASAWVHTNLDYVSGSSRPTDGAPETLLARAGVCRDFAHVTVALLRAMDVPARLCSVYAPGLAPMDFHAVVEAAPEGVWEVVDATRLAPRASLVRIATGRDAADTAFLTTAGMVTLSGLRVTAVVEPDLPREDPGQVVRLR